MPESSNKQNNPQSKTAEEIAKEKELEEKALQQKEAARIKAAQTRTEILETNKDGKPTKTKDVTSDLVPKPEERKFYHVELETPSYDPKTGKKLSKPRTQIFTDAEWAQIEKNKVALGYETKVLWNPTKYNE